MLKARDKRIAEAIKQSLTFLFDGEMSDPRVPETVTICHVDVTPDLRNAKVYYSIDPDDKGSRRAMEELLEDCQGFLRSRVAEDVNIKMCPSLSFHYDRGQKNYERIDEILRQVGQKKGETPASGGGELAKESRSEDD